LQALAAFNGSVMNCCDTARFAPHDIARTAARTLTDQTLASRAQDNFAPSELQIDPTSIPDNPSVLPPVDRTSSVPKKPPRVQYPPVPPCFKDFAESPLSHVVPFINAAAPWFQSMLPDPHSKSMNWARGYELQSIATVAKMLLGSRCEIHTIMPRAGLLIMRVKDSTDGSAVIEIKGMIPRHIQRNEWYTKNRITAMSSVATNHVMTQKIHQFEGQVYPVTLVGVVYNPMTLTVESMNSKVVDERGARIDKVRVHKPYAQRRRERAAAASAARAATSVTASQQSPPSVPEAAS